MSLNDVEEAVHSDRMSDKQYDHTPGKAAGHPPDDMLLRFQSINLKVSVIHQKDELNRTSSPV